ncbi:flagellar basal body-associated FliL family protein [Terricaulis sp.]|uniref:flagellar basal body-associated FliL family protein n=1 Tax=Terricaulis sp. TaxID=2768686 RepID=UPI0037839A25
MLGKKKDKKKKKGEKPEADAEAEGAAPPAEGEGVEGAEGEPKKKKMSGKMLVLFIILPAILVLGGGGAAAYLLLAKPSGEQHAEEGGHGKQKAKGHGGEGGEAEAVEGPNGTTITQGEGVVFVGLPEMLVNIQGPDGRPAYLKLKLTIEAPDDEAVAALTEAVPRVTDQFNGFLREMRTDDLAGSAGAYRLRLELLRRVNLAIAPTQVNAVLIEEMLVQ